MSDLIEQKLADIQRRLAALEAETEIRQVVARYMELCDDLTPESPMDEMGELFSTDAVWEGKGEAYEDAFGGHIGRENIVAFLFSYSSPPHFSSNVHFLTSETISVDAETANGTWVMLQTPTFSNGESFVLAARLILDFKLEEGRWRIHRFRTTNLLGRPIDGGWHSEAAIPTPAQQ